MIINTHRQKLELFIVIQMTMALTCSMILVSFGLVPPQVWYYTMVFILGAMFNRLIIEGK